MKREDFIDPLSFIHPLSVLETITTEEGEKEVINSWAFASLIWSEVLNAGVNSGAIAKELFSDEERFLKLYFRSCLGDEAALREAVAVLASAIDEKLAQAFEQTH